MSERRQINIPVDGRVYERLAEHAKKASMPVGTYARMLFDAAYAARCRETGDFDLDATVAGALILSGAGLDVGVVARALRIEEPVVRRILKVWTNAGATKPEARA